ncbi:hypothetical protein DPMN_177046 [Dreissena polymorpha]|uniref:Uncharacterized protein n=1 Tax=Dreissena polymorpha TaxID=45954 RepID=A0A9D4IIN1_DREPO|nr:hypothetical protein DPMN_177046 [Dreissena polymorpha]
MTFIHSSRYVQLVPIPSYPVASPSTEPVLSQFDYVQRDDRKNILSRLKVLKDLSRSTPFQAVNKVRRQFVTRCYYDHSVLTQFEPV